MKSFVLFVVGSLLFGVVVLGIAYWLGGDPMLIQGATAFGLAFVPAAGTLAWVNFSFRSTPDMKLLASLGGSGFRMGIVLGGAWLLMNWQPDTFDATFLYWLILFYLVLLAFEITILVWQDKSLADGRQER